MPRDTLGDELQRDRHGDSAVGCKQEYTIECEHEGAVGREIKYSIEQDRAAKRKQCHTIEREEQYHSRCGRRER
jgi:hypothetical protein